MSSLMDTDVLDLLVQDEDLEELLLSSSCPFVFHSGMNCPLVTCGFSSFKTKKELFQTLGDQTKTPSHHHLLFYSQMQVNLQEEDRYAVPPSIHPPSDSTINYCCFELNNIVRYFFFYKTYIAFYNNSYFFFQNG